MKPYGLKRFKGCGCNHGKVKAVVSDWKKRYDKSEDYTSKFLPRVKTERIHYVKETGI